MMIRLLNIIIVAVVLVRVSLCLKCYLCADVKYNQEAENVDKRWRDDGRCGPGFNLSDSGEDAECNPDKGNECCSSDGWCGSTTIHCCNGCVKYTRSFGDFDLPTCSKLEKTVTVCEKDENVCIVVKIATNTTVQEVDRYQTLRRCGIKDADHCDKYTTAGHTCLWAWQCREGRCNAAQNVGLTYSTAVVVAIFVMLV